MLNLREASKQSGWSHDQLKRFCQDGRIAAEKRPPHPGSSKVQWFISRATLAQLKRWRQASVPVVTGRTYEKKKKEATEE